MILLNNRPTIVITYSKQEDNFIHKMELLEIKQRRYISVISDMNLIWVQVSGMIKRKLISKYDNITF